MVYDGIYLSRVVKPQLVTYQQNTTALGLSLIHILFAVEKGEAAVAAGPCLPHQCLQAENVIREDRHAVIEHMICLLYTSRFCFPVQSR